MSDRGQSNSDRLHAFQDIIDQLCEEIRETEDEHTRIGKIEVLAQFAGHHILEELERMARLFIMAQTEIIATVAH